MKPIFSIGLKRSIEDSDIYGVRNDMQSESNTEAFAEAWEIESKKPNPSIFRVMFRLHGFKILTIGILFSLGETMAK